MIRVAQYGRRWFSAYAENGAYLAMGNTRAEARSKAETLLIVDPLVIRQSTRHVVEDD